MHQVSSSTYFGNSGFHLKTNYKEKQSELKERNNFEQLPLLKNLGHPGLFFIYFCLFNTADSN